MKKVFNMIALAMRGHENVPLENQFRKWQVGEKDRYFVHPLRCWRRYLFVTPQPNEDEECGMIGHDLLEDTSVTEQDIIKASGEEALRIIQELTFPTSAPEWEGRPRAEKREVEWAHLRKIRPKTRRLKMIDRWDNLDGMANPTTPLKMAAKYVLETDTLLEICEASDYTIAAYVREQQDILRAYLKEKNFSLYPPRN